MVPATLSLSTEAESVTLGRQGPGTVLSWPHWLTGGGAGADGANQDRSMIMGSIHRSLLGYSAHR